MEREQASKSITKIQIIKRKFVSLTLLLKCPSFRCIVVYCWGFEMNNSGWTSLQKAKETIDNMRF